MMKHVVLLTTDDGRAAFRERLESLEGGSPAVRLSDLFQAAAFSFGKAPWAMKVIFTVRSSRSGL